jgi:acetoin utilization protein AcuB
MLVEKIMTKDVIALTPTDTIYSAVLLMKEKKIRHIPIINEDFHLIGLVSDRNIRDAAPSIFRTNEYKEALQSPIHSIMKTDVIFGHPLDFVEEIGAIFYENKISCLPIVKEKKLVGMITDSDLLHSFVELTGVNKPGSQIEIKVPHKTGVLYEIFAIFKKRNIIILSVLVYPDQDRSEDRILVIRVQTMNPSIVVEDLIEFGYEVLWPSLAGKLS